MARQRNSRTRFPNSHQSVTAAAVSAGALGESAPPDRAPDHDEIALRAYLHWQARGGGQGSAEEDWFRAEQEVRARHPVAK